MNSKKFQRKYNDKSQKTFDAFPILDSYSKEHRLSLLFAKRNKIFRKMKRDIKRCKLLSSKTEIMTTYCHDVKWIDNDIKVIRYGIQERNRFVDREGK